MKDYFDNDDLNDMFDDNNSFKKQIGDLETMLNEFEKKRFENMVMENYNNIKEKGIDIVTLAKYGDENINKLKETLVVMLDFFLEREEYEKCADIRDISEKIENM